MKTKIAVNAASGKMGQQVISQATSHSQVELTAAFCRSDHRLLGRQVGFNNIEYTSDIEQGLNQSDVVIDFSLPEGTMELVKQTAKTKTPLIIGTTGFSDEQISELKDAAKNFPVLLAPNTSIGVNSTLALLSLAAKMLGKQADIEIIEAHHKHKIDAPSGTAIRMGQAIAEAMGENFNDLKTTDSRFEKRTRKKGEIGMSVIRAGEIIGEHKVLFALDNEIISIEHKAQNRHCFAEGAVEAAVWLAQQPAGFYTMQDFLANR
ncbi:4-hydroxy-tetrahydrodipicolinate reductase [Aliikangiella coralliicola]|uniref:4-hydroxy-tetrahydrodipicolinate reductase n=1 Tax=Aliikangiella coralliicola TaxID=2592383 RepID=A0A545UGP0_9GAMM|nr:4-hydroxy-tetrahydrodipicolinate reductase [Aliikangiella coralliicola]TQV88652.1 4-hydroxy-tetrahydrodipicolinate reductase [Aliikangiella coralliicola]